MANYELIHAQIAVLDLTYKINKHHSFRFETQGLGTDEDQGDWHLLNEIHLVRIGM